MGRCHRIAPQTVTDPLYPRRFEMVRLEALGEPAYLGIDEAQRRYDEERGLSVVSGERPVSWSVEVSPKRRRFVVTFYTRSGTPLRAATWEEDDDRLLCRRTVDLFYPDGDPGRRVPFIDLVTVTQHVSADGVIGVELSSPIDDDEVLEVAGAELNGLRVTMPTFGEWTPLLEASAPIVLDRFGVDSIPAAIALAHASAPSNARVEADATDSGWRVPAGDRDLMKAIDNVIDALPARRGIPVLPRGAASILPLAVQADLEGSGRDPHEERRRMRDLAANVGAALEYREGRPIPVDFGRRADDRVTSYVTALRNAGATSADWWAYGARHGVTIVWTGDEADGTLALALHVVPASWVSTRRTKAAIDGVDVRWSIADVDTPDSLA